MDDDRPAGEDSLLLFPAEPDRPARTRVPSGDGALSEFLSEAGASDVPVAPLPEPDIPATGGPVWLLRNGPAWCVGAAVVLCGLVVGTAVWTMREPAPDPLRDAAGQRPGGIPPSDRSSLPELPARRAAAGARLGGSSAAAAPRGGAAEREAVGPGRPVWAAESPRRATAEHDVDEASAGMAPLAASALDPATLTGALAEGRDTERIPSDANPLAAAAIEALPLSIDAAAEEGDRPATMRDAGAPSEAGRASAAIEESDAVRRTLEAYRLAYERLDVRAAAEVWPTVDRPALTRAFSTLESQDVTLGDCEIQVEAATATARCRGMVRFVPAFGSRAPVNTPTGWLFRMRKAGQSWTIEDVSGAAAARTGDNVSGPTR